MQFLSQRSHEQELMDDNNIPFTEFHDCLQELERINHLTLAYRPTLKWLGHLLETATIMLSSMQDAVVAIRCAKFYEPFLLVTRYGLLGLI